MALLFSIASFVHKILVYFITLSGTICLQMRQQKGDHTGAIKVLDKALSSGKEELVSDQRIPY